MRLPRFRIWTLMIVVAVAACLIASELLRRRREEYRQEAAAQAKLEAIAKELADNLFALPGSASDYATWANEAREQWRLQANYHAARKAEYERAARRPWLWVKPNPPPSPAPPPPLPPPPPAQ